MSLARSYIADHLQAGKYEFHVCTDDYLIDFASHNVHVKHALLIKSKLLSRHMSQRWYAIFILIDLDAVPSRSIVTHLFTCKNGARTIKACAHVITIIWYLGYGRHVSVHGPSEFLNENYFHLKPRSDETEEDSSDADEP